MRKVLVFQHVAHAILGTLNPMLKEQGFRIRYVNFDRDPNSRPTIEKYDGLIILGGHMGVYEAAKYSHIQVEMALIEKALKKGIPILGICLGAQMLAQVLGSHVRKSPEKEMGWYDLHLTSKGQSDSLLKHFKKTEKVFQMHGDTFDVPKQAEHLAFSKACQGQAFRFGKNVYGLQFHLEADRPMIDRWLNNPRHHKDFLDGKNKFTIEQIKNDSEVLLNQSINLSQKCFAAFLDHFGEFERHKLLGSGHGKSKL